MSSPEPQSSPTLIIVMGVSGCGKTGVANAVAGKLSMEFIEADEHHNMEAKAMMKAGKPLTDTMREPWIQSLCSAINVLTRQNRSVILACSALRKGHRQIFRSLGLPCHFIYLEGSEALIGTRLHNRIGHFFPPVLLRSQFEALQDPKEEVDVTPVDITPPLEKVVQQSIVVAQRFTKDVLT